MNDDNKKAAEWHKSVLELFQKLPQYNENDFNFEIEIGHTGSPEREQYYFVEKGKYCSYFYDWRDLSKKSTKNFEEAIYWILEDRIFNYVTQYEKNHRIRYVDGRRQWFKLEQDMYNIIGKPYSEIKRKEQIKTLRQAPFDDAVTCRIDLVDDYEKIESWIQASEYEDMLKHFPNMTKLLSLWRSKKGVPDFEKLFAQARNEIIHFYNFLVESTEPHDELYPVTFFKLVKHCEEIAKKYLIP